MTENKLLVLGNPLLDISAVVEPGFLTKYGLKNSDAILAGEEHLPIFEDVLNYPVNYIPGGAAQNTARVTQWMSQIPGFVSYIGCIGKDKFGEEMKKAVERDGLNTLYQITEEYPTGTCAALAVEGDRSLVTNLGAANHYQFDHFKQKEIHKTIEHAKVVYISGFFLTVSPETVEYVGKYCAEHNIIFTFNLAAPFVIDVFFDRVKMALRYADVVFGNEHEAAALGKKMGWSEDFKEIGQKLSGLEKANGRRSRSVVFTLGCEPTMFYSDSTWHERPVVKISKDKLVDTNGAGDSFCGGFLWSLVEGAKDIGECVKAGAYAASEIIQQEGCTLPDKPHYIST